MDAPAVTQTDTTEADRIELAARLAPRQSRVVAVDLDAPQARQSTPAARLAAQLPPELAKSQDIAAIARHYTRVAVDTLAEIAGDVDAPASARVAAANTLLERGHGKAVATTVMANPDGSALFAGVEIVLVAPRARVLEHARDDAMDGLARDDDA